MRRNRIKERCLVIYDISDDKRRRKFVKLVESYGCRVQKSAFEVCVSSDRYRELSMKIAAFVQTDMGEDIRVYRMHEDFDVVCFTGTEAFDEKSVLII